ncbi:TetR/AcrR family transcriptional regulator [Streptomyces sp. JV190]|uniref:TetR/AcrR family transcriptional regulator n=1 Tax=Streptomyces sp. JV190 TaxID=3002533 RepID=UPI002E77303C|nr:TetR/AcrR family transcriptional regulator [Streptomyces sp. JV190]MEE1841003.1 TetR/AcrR family transcriptional regulator [Streptomyces sp. JV190]
MENGVDGPAEDGEGPGQAGDRRARILDSAVDHVAAHGIADLSLRRLGAGIGVSHRMLIHYFGTKEQLLVEIVRASERRQRDLLSRLRVEPGLSPADAARNLWRQLTSPELSGQTRLFFELYGQAVQGRPEAAPVLDGLITDWLAPLAAVETAGGADPATARARARLGLAVVRGLLLDLLATGDRDGVDAAMEQFLAVYYPADTDGEAPIEPKGPRA